MPPLKLRWNRYVGAGVKQMVLESVWRRFLWKKLEIALRMCAVRFVTDYGKLAIFPTLLCPKTSLTHLAISKRRC